MTGSYWHWRYNEINAWCNMYYGAWFDGANVVCERAFDEFKRLLRAA